MPVELPSLLTILLGALAPFIIQLIKKYFKSRLMRLLIAVSLTGVTGWLAFIIVRPPGLVLPEALAWIFAASQLGYQFWKSIWASYVRG